MYKKYLKTEDISGSTKRDIDKLFVVSKKMGISDAWMKDAEKDPNNSSDASYLLMTFLNSVNDEYRKGVITDDEFTKIVLMADTIDNGLVDFYGVSKKEIRRAERGFSRYERELLAKYL